MGMIFFALSMPGGFIEAFRLSYYEGEPEGSLLEIRLRRL